MNFSFKTLSIIFSISTIIIVSIISTLNTYDLFLKDKEAEALSSLAVNAKYAMLNIRQDLINSEIDNINAIESINNETYPIVKYRDNFAYLSIFNRNSNTNETLIDGKAIPYNTISEFIRSEKQTTLHDIGKKIYQLKKLITNDELIYIFGTTIDKSNSGGIIELGNNSHGIDNVRNFSILGKDYLEISIPINEQLIFTMRKNLEIYNKIPQYILVTIAKSMIITIVFLMTISLLMSHSFSRPIQIVSDTIRNYSSIKKISFENKSNVKEIRSIQNSFEDLTQKLSGFQSIMFSNIDQGIFIIKNDHCLDEIFSQKCIEFFGSTPNNKDFIKYIDIGNNIDHDQVKSWLDLLFSGRAEIQDITAISPTFVETSRNPLEANYKRIEFEYFEIRENDNLKSILVISKDKSKEYINRENLKQLTSKTEIITAYYKNKENYESFINDIKNLFEIILNNEEVDSYKNRDLLEKLHTLKGLLGIFGFSKCQKMIHKVEEFCLNNDPFINATRLTLNQFETDLKYLESEVGDLVEKNNNYIATKTHLCKIRNLYNTDSHLVMDEINRMINGMSLQMTLKSFERPLIKLAENSNKDIFEFEFIGDDYYYPANENEIFNNLIHVFKNSIEHAISEKEIRKSIGKNEKGRLTIFTNNIKDRFDSGFLQLRISDDGEGFDFVKIKERLKIDLDINEQNIIDILTTSKISSSGKASLDSGRNLGLSSAYETIVKHGGTATLKTNKTGTSFEIYLPTHHNDGVTDV